MDQLKEIGLRLKGLREGLGMTKEEFARSCNIDLTAYIQYEAGEHELSITALRQISATHNIDSSILVFADEPRMNSYFLTRKGKGLSVKRQEKFKYKYQTLAGGFNNRKAEIFEVSVEPREAVVTDSVKYSSHEGQEFIRVLDGKMLLHINNKDLILEEGDSIYFDSGLKHYIEAMDNNTLRFITVLI